MADAKNSERVKILKESMGRLSRLLEAENASIQSLMTAGAQNSVGNIGTGLGRLLSEGAAIAPTPAVSGKAFAEGVWTSTEENDGANRMVVEFVPADRGAEDADGIAPRGPRLGIHPVITSVHSPRWVTLETEVDKASIVADATLAFNIVADFHFPEPRQPLSTNTANIVIRRYKSDENYGDIDFGHFPITTVPMAHSLINRNVNIDAAALAQCTRIAMIIFLPKYGNYTFNLYGLSVGSE